MMQQRTAYIAYRGNDNGTGVWTPIARITSVSDGYQLCYTQGIAALPSQRRFQGMVDLEGQHHMPTLAPILSAFVAPNKQASLIAMQTWTHINPDCPIDPISIITLQDSDEPYRAIEVFPQPTMNAHEEYQIRFFMHGVRHLDPWVRARLTQLRAHQPLFIKSEHENTADTQAIGVWADIEGYKVRIGYIPRYLTQEMREVAKGQSWAKDLYVSSVHPRAPLQTQIICHFSIPWPRTEYRPLSAKPFQPYNSAESCSRTW